MPLWLLALFLNAFSCGLFAAAKAPAEMVYCPLAKRLQPVKAPQKTIRKNSLDDICADKAAKIIFLDELFSSRNLPAVDRLKEPEFENLFFDFSRIGEAAFRQLPPPPDFPRRDALRSFSAAAGLCKNDEAKFVWKLNAANFSFAGSPRPPTTVSAICYRSRNLRELKKISRRRAPRAPPFSL